eukprot:gene21644-57846_t
MGTAASTPSAAGISGIALPTPAAKASRDGFTPASPGLDSRSDTHCTGHTAAFAAVCAAVRRADRERSELGDARSTHGRELNFGRSFNEHPTGALESGTRHTTSYDPPTRQATQRAESQYPSHLSPPEQPMSPTSPANPTRRSPNFFPLPRAGKELDEEEVGVLRDIVKGGDPLGMAYGSGAARGRGILLPESPVRRVFAYVSFAVVRGWWDASPGPGGHAVLLFASAAAGGFTAANLRTAVLDARQRGVVNDEDLDQIRRLYGRWLWIDAAAA